MSRFLTYSISVALCASLLFFATSCCEYYQEPQQYIEFIILDKAGDNVLLSNTLPESVIRYYPVGFRNTAISPVSDVNRGVFIMTIIPKQDYQIDIINQSFATLSISYARQKEQCGSYDQISAVTVNGIPWDYQSNAVLTLIYNP